MGLATATDYCAQELRGPEGTQDDADTPGGAPANDANEASGGEPAAEPAAEADEDGAGAPLASQAAPEPQPAAATTAGDGTDRPEPLTDSASGVPMCIVCGKKPAFFDADEGRQHEYCGRYCAAAHGRNAVHVPRQRRREVARLAPAPESKLRAVVREAAQDLEQGGLGKAVAAVKSNLRLLPSPAATPLVRPARTTNLYEVKPAPARAAAPPPVPAP